ncbi:MAG: GNAT family N-acetyltransferase [Pedococcus sp.]
MVERDPSRWVVDALRADDHEGWARLHRGYLDFYEVSDPERVSPAVWAWLQDPVHELECLVVRPEIGAAPVGLAHYRPFPRPLAGTTACFLDDLFVEQGVRGTGAVDALLGALQGQCRDRGWSQVRWITRASNARARSTYDRLAVQTDLVTYDLPR